MNQPNNNSTLQQIILREMVAQGVAQQHYAVLGQEVLADNTDPHNFSSRWQLLAGNLPSFDEAWAQASTANDAGQHVYVAVAYMFQPRHNLTLPSALTPWQLISTLVPPQHVVYANLQLQALLPQLPPPPELSMPTLGQASLARFLPLALLTVIYLLFAAWPHNLIGLVVAGVLWCFEALCTMPRLQWLHMATRWRGWFYVLLCLLAVTPIFLT